MLFALSGCSDDVEDRGAGARPTPTPSSGSAAPTAAPASPGSAGPVTSDSCPISFLASATPWVPAPPTTETPGRLAPDADPVTAVVCRYQPIAAGMPTSGAGPAALVGEVSLTSGLDRVRVDLALPLQSPGPAPTCPPTSGPRVPHLMRLDYADGSLWLSAVQEAGSCTVTGNGAFVTGTYLGGVLAGSYDAAGWTFSP